MIRENQDLLNRINIFLDGCLVFLSFMMGFVVRFYILPGGTMTMPTSSYLMVALALVPIHLFT